MLRSLEKRINDAQQRTVTFATTNTMIDPEIPSSQPLSRVTSIASSEYADAFEEWPQMFAAGDVSVFSSFDTNEIDELHAKGEFQLCYDKLKDALEQEPQNPEILWRLSRSGYNLVSALEKKNSARKTLVLESYKYAAFGYGINPTNFNVVKWAAANAGMVCEVSGNKERIKMGYEFKKYLDEALVIDGKDTALLHMRGRYAYAISNLTRFERMAASALFATPPTATVEEALTDFLEVEKLRPNQWIENLLYTGLCYVAKKDYTNAREYFKKAIEVKPTDLTDEDAIKEAKKALKSISK